MKQIILTAVLFCILCSAVVFDNAHSYSLPPSYLGQEINLNDYQGKKILIVNTATSSDKVAQFASLEQLSQLYHDSLIIVAVPSNSFGNEQLSDSALVEYLDQNYEASFLLSGQIQVTGPEMHPLYHWLSEKPLNQVLTTPVVEDFQKFLIDENGNLMGIFSSVVDPLSSDIQDAIKGF